MSDRNDRSETGMYLAAGIIGTFMVCVTMIIMTWMGNCP